MPHEEDPVRPDGLVGAERKEVVLLSGDVPGAGVGRLDHVVALERHEELARLGEPLDDELEGVKVVAFHSLLEDPPFDPGGEAPPSYPLARDASSRRRRCPAPGCRLTGGPALLEAVPGAERYPARHHVHDAVLVRGGERIPVVVKRIRRDFRQPDGRTRAERAEQIARHLLARGIDTPEPLAIEVTPEESVLVVRKLDGAVQIREFFLRRDEPSRDAPAVAAAFEEVVAALGRLARRLHDAGVFFRDFSDGNVLVTPGPRLWLVDLDRARVRSGPLGTFDRLRDLSRPGLNRPEDRRLLLEAYYAPAPVPPVVAGLLSVFRARLVGWNRFKRAVRPWRR